MSQNSKFVESSKVWKIKMLVSVIRNISRANWANRGRLEIALIIHLRHAHIFPASSLERN